MAMGEDTNLLLRAVGFVHGSNDLLYCGEVVQLEHALLHGRHLPQLRQHTNIESAYRQGLATARQAQASPLPGK